MSRDPGRLEKIRVGIRNRSPWLDAVLSTIVEADAIYHRSLLIYQPKLKTVSMRPFSNEISEELKRKILTQGFEACYPDIRKLLGDQADFDAIWGWARKIYMTVAGTVLAGVGAHENYVKTLAQEQQDDDEEMSSDKPTGAEAARLLLETMKDLFRTKYGRDPNEAEIQAMVQAIESDNTTPEKAASRSPRSSE